MAGLYLGSAAVDLGGAARLMLGAEQVWPVSGGALPWTPTDLPGGVAHWYDAADVSTLTLSGTTVLEWADKSGNGHDLTQGNADKRGTRLEQNSNFNSLPTIAFPSGGGMTSATKASHLTSEYIVDGWTGGSGQGPSYGSVGAPAGWTLPANSILAMRAPAGSLETTNVLHRLNGAAIATTWKDDNISLGGPVTAFFAGRIKSYGQGTIYGRIFSANATFALGNRASDWARTGDKDFAEIVIVSAELPLEDIERSEGYLAHKWGLTGLLPSEHPYKSTPPMKE